MAKYTLGDRPIDPPEQMMTRGATQPIPAQSLHAARMPSRRPPSYHPTGWALADRALEVVDNVTGGRAEWVRRVFSYLVIGGFAAVVNLIVFAVMLHLIALPVAPHVHYIIANLTAAEISILANFVPNDRFTFRYLPGHQRMWLARCARFHLTAIGGTVVTLIISVGLNGLGLPGIIAQAIGLIIALIFNFTLHHLFTYHGSAHMAH